MEGYHERELKELFQNASKFMTTIAGEISSDQLLYFYARYKQANEGPCNIPKPGFFDFQGKQKWDAWNNLGKKSKSDAMREYISELTNIYPDWEDKLGKGEHKGNTGMGVRVSAMSNQDEEISDEQKTLFDWCKEGEREELQKILSNQNGDVNIKDEEGMALLHWACDRGHDEIVQLLLNYKADINIKDADGQTPIHYAVSCEHVPVIKTLLAGGALCTLEDNDGITPKQATDRIDIQQMLDAQV